MSEHSCRDNYEIYSHNKSSSFLVGIFIVLVQSWPYFWVKESLFQYCEVRGFGEKWYLFFVRFKHKHSGKLSTCSYAQKAGAVERAGIVSSYGRCEERKYGRKGVV